MADNVYSLDLETSSNQGANITDATQTGLDFTTNFTMEGRFNPESLPADGHHYKIAGKWASGNNYLWVLRNDAGTYYQRVYLRKAPTTDTLNKAITTPSTGTWYHWAVTWTAATSTVEYYVNGASQGTTVGTITSLDDNASPFELGMLTGDDDFWDGLIDEFRVWNVVRTANQIKYWMQRDVTGQTGLQGYWKLENNYTDSSGNGNTLTPVATPVFSTTVPFTDYTKDGGAFLLNFI
jgi:hypothetical protein